MAKKKVAMLTAGGLAPCLSSAVGGLIERYTDIAPDYELVAYRSGYQGLLLADRIEITPAMREKAHVLHRHGGSPIGNSRVKLTNTADCVKRGLVKEGENPLRVAAERLASDGISILHTIGGDDTNTTAADLAAYLGANGYDLTVVGLPKTVDNDVVPIRQTLGAWTAAEYGARFFDHVSNEQSAAPRTLVVHEVMGRHCGWLTAATARAYIHLAGNKEYVDGFMMNAQLKNIDGLYLPEMAFDLEAEAARLREVMDRAGFVTLFVSEGACLDAIVAERGGRRRDGQARRVRPCEDRYDQRRKLVLQAVRGAPRRRALNGAEVRLLCTLRPRQCRRSAPHPEHGRSGGRERAQQGLRRDGPRRGSGRAAAHDRVPAHQGRKAFRHVREVVRRGHGCRRPEVADGRLMNDEERFAVF
ncbi:6-phosphofructokinase [Sinorhizobium meliloti]